MVRTATLSKLTAYRVDAVLESDISVGDMVRITDDELASAFEGTMADEDNTDGEFEYHRYGYVTESHTEDFSWYDPDDDEQVTVKVPDDETVYIVSLAPLNAGSHPVTGDQIEPADEEDVMSGLDIDADMSDAEEEMATIRNPTYESTACLHSAQLASMDELDDVYSEWSDAVNMTASELRRWSKNPCSREASKDPIAVIKRNLRLLEKDKSDWTTNDIEDANRTISFISRMSDEANKPDSPTDGAHGCPSEWAISLLNWAYNPFDDLPAHSDELDAVEEVTLGTYVPAHGVAELQVSMDGVPRITRNQMGLQPWPESWRESNKPARLIALDAWTSMGGTFRGCRRSMIGDMRNPNRFCASWKDSIYGHTYWREGG